MKSKSALRNANTARRALAAKKQLPLPLEEQLKRRDERRAEHLARYPEPPTYGSK